MSNETTEHLDEDSLMSETIVVDGHADTILKHGENGFSLVEENEEGHIDVPRMKKGKVSAQFFAIWLDPEMGKENYLQTALEKLDLLHNLCEENQDKIQVAKTPFSVWDLHSRGIVSAIPCIEGGHAIRDNLAFLRTFHRLGVRYMTLTWMNNNNWADASGDEEEHGGLTEFGRDVVREMNRLGMIVDLSHVSVNAFEDAIETTEAPVIASHSCCRALNDHHRNLNDAQLKVLSENNGVIGICFYPGFLDAEFSRAMEEYREENEDAGWSLPDDRRPSVPISRILDHIDHAVEVAGIDHVALGSDFDGVSALPDGMEDCSDLPKVTRGLIERGYERDEITKILGENFMRVFRDVVEIGQ